MIVDLQCFRITSILILIDYLFDFLEEGAFENENVRPMDRRAIN